MDAPHSDSPLTMTKSKKRYTCMAGKPRCVKLHIHTSVRVSYTTIHCINVPVKSKFQHPPRAYPGHLMPFLAREGGNLITNHRGWGIWSLASMSCYEINHGEDGGDVKLWWIQRKRLRICGGLVENQRPTQAVFRIWRCLRTIYIHSIQICVA